MKAVVALLRVLEVALAWVSSTTGRMKIRRREGGEWSKGKCIASDETSAHPTQGNKNQ